MKISIIVPVFNVENELERCVKCICAQTHSELEIILVDDGSTDESRNVIEKLSCDDGRIKKIFKKNGGVTSARLAGVQVATGEWIGFVDGDDEIEPQMYEVLIDNAVKYNAQISHCGYQMIFPDGRKNYFYNTGIVEIHDSTTAVKELLSGEKIEPGLVNKLFHKSLFLGLNELMDPSIRINEDLLMNYYLFRNASYAVFQDFCPYHYMVRYSSASRQKKDIKKIFDPIKVKRIILEDAAENVFDYAMKAYLATLVNVYNGLCRVDVDYTDDKKMIRQMLIEKKQHIKFLNKKTKFLADMILYIPLIYPLIYRIYSDHFQKKRYE